MLTSSTKTKFENITNLTTDNIPPRLANAVLSVGLLTNKKTEGILKNTPENLIDFYEKLEVFEERVFFQSILVAKKQVFKRNKSE